MSSPYLSSVRHKTLTVLLHESSPHRRNRLSGSRDATPSAVDDRRDVPGGTILPLSGILCVCKLTSGSSCSPMQAPVSSARGPGPHVSCICSIAQRVKHIAMRTNLRKSYHSEFSQTPTFGGPLIAHSVGSLSLSYVALAVCLCNVLDPTTRSSKVRQTAVRPNLSWLAPRI